MRFDVVTVLPDLLRSPFEHSIMKRAIKKGILELNIINLRDYTTYNHKQVDDYQYGGGAGMVLMLEPLVNCIEAQMKNVVYDDIILTTPDGETFNQAMSNQMSMKQNFLIVCGHYKGVDQRFRDHFITKEISIGDYVLSGGELAAAVIVDSVTRLIPGVLNDETSALSDSFQDNLLAAPIYTRPAEYRGWKVPQILMDGHHTKIADWQYEQALDRTKQRRPDLLKKK